MSFVRSRLSWNTPHLDSPFQVAILVSVVAFLSYVSTMLGAGIAVPPHNISPLWPTNAVVLVVLLVVRQRLWPILIGTAYAVVWILDVRFGVPSALSVWLVLGNVVEVVVAVFGVRFFFKRVPRLNNTRALVQYSLCAAILGPFTGAFIGALASKSGSYWLHWRMWFLSDALALLALPPVVWGLSYSVLNWRRRSLAYYLELGTLTVVMVVCGYVAFVASGKNVPQALFYPLVPLLLWCAFRLGSMGTGISVTVISVLAIWGAVRGRGPFLEPAPADSVLSLQLFLLCTAAPFVVLATLVEEHQESEQALREKEERLRVAAEVGRMYAWEWDPTTDSVLRSAEAAGIVGPSAGTPEAKAKDYFNWIHPDDRDGLWKVVNSLTPETPIYRTQYRRLHPDGTLLWLEESGYATFDKRGKMIRLVGMTADVTVRKHAEESLANVSRRLIEAQEQERARISRELHDDIGQRLAMLSNGLAQLQRDSADLPAEVGSLTDELLEQTRGIATDVQSLSHELHSSKLEVLGMSAAMKSFCREFSENQKVEIDFETHDLPRFLPPNISLCLFRVLQEAIRNSAKHSTVRHFEVRSWGTPDEIHLTVEDSGVGFELEAVRNGRGLGLTSMEERLKLLKGTLSIESQPSRGTTVHARVPVRLGI